MTKHGSARRSPRSIPAFRMISSRHEFLSLPNASAYRYAGSLDDNVSEIAQMKEGEEGEGERGGRERGENIPIR